MEEDDKNEEDEYIRTCDVVKIIIVNKALLIIFLILTYILFNNQCTIKHNTLDYDGFPMIMKIVGFIMMICVITGCINEKMKPRRINRYINIYWLLMFMCNCFKMSMLMMGLNIYLVNESCITTNPIIHLFFFIPFSVICMMGEFILAYLICKLKRSEVLDEFLNKK